MWLEVRATEPSDTPEHLLADDSSPASTIRRQKSGAAGNELTRPASQNKPEWPEPRIVGIRMFLVFPDNGLGNNEKQT